MVRISLVSLLAAASTALASANRVPGGFIVELADGHNADSVINAVDGASKRLDLNYKLFKGVSIQVHDTDKADEKAGEIASLPSVKRVWPIQVVRVPDENVRVVGNASFSVLGPRADKSNDTFAPHVMTQVDKLRAKGITGKGVKIAVVDTGADYTHPALGGCFGENCLVSFGTDLVGDAYTGYNIPQPDADPMDCNGHGSHVSGIIAAKPNEYGFTGAAPGVSLGMYRVFGCDGLASTDILIAAFNKAFEDGADIITASIVGAAGWSEEPWAVVAQRIVEQGVSCTISAGNDGDHGLFYSSNAADAKRVISVASYDNVVTPVLYYDASYSVDEKNTTFGYVEGVPGPWGVTKPIYATSFNTTVADDACDPLPDDTPDLSGYIVLVRRGGCLFDDKVRNLVPKGAQYVMVYNNVDGIFAPTLSAQKGNINSIGMTDSQTGATWVKDLKAGEKLVANVPSYFKAKSHLTTTKNTLTGGGLSLFTSWGPNWEMDFKPQIGAPGGNILSTYPLAKGGYAVLSGTSMSCPITAAIIALISEVRGTLDPLTIEDLLSATANPQLFNDGTKFYGALAPAAQQGGGLVQAYDAAYTTTFLYPSSMSFNDTENFVSSLNFTITNKGSAEVTYSLSHVPALTMYTLADDSIYPAKFPNQAVDSHASLSFSQDKITLPAGHRGTINVMPTPPSGLDGKRLPLWSGYVAINGTDGSSLSMPYQGLTGSLHKSTVLASDQSWIFNSNDSATYTKVPSNTTFTLPAPGTAGPNDNLPAVYVNLALGSPLLRIDVIPMTTCPPNSTATVLGVKSIGQPLGQPSPYDSRGVSWWSWDGKLDSGTYAPAGKYKFVARALRIYGDARKRGEYDVAETQGFKIRYM